MPRAKRRFVNCVNAGTYKASLEPRKVCRVVPDSSAEAKSLVRVVDDSGEDYLFPARLFVPMEVPHEGHSGLIPRGCASVANRLHEGAPAVEQADAADAAQGGTRTASGGAALCPRGRDGRGTASELIASVRPTIVG